MSAIVMRVLLQRKRETDSFITERKGTMESFKFYGIM